MCGESNHLGSTTAQEAAATALRTNAANNYNNLAGMGYADLAALGLGPSFGTPGQSTPITANGVPENIAPGSGTADTGGSGFGTIAALGLNQYNAAQSGGNTATAEFENAAGLANTTGSTTTLPSPYQLTQPQQQELNTQTDILNQRGNEAQQALAASYAARGITDPNAIAAGQALLGEATGGLVNGYQATYAANVQQNAQNAAQQLQSYYNTSGQEGASMLEGGVTGANQLIQSGAGGQLETAGANQSAAQASQTQANNVSNQLSSTIGSLLGIGANAATGGYSGLFGGGSGGTADTGAGSTSPSFLTQPTIGATDAGTGNPTTATTAYNTPLAPYDVTAYGGYNYGYGGLGGTNSAAAGYGTPNVGPTNAGN